MTDKHWVDVPGREPIKILKNRNRPGVIVRQATSVIFLDLEIADRVVDAVCDTIDQIETGDGEVTR